jgi:hypothetical protein
LLKRKRPDRYLNHSYEECLHARQVTGEPRAH